MASIAPFKQTGADDRARFFTPALWRQRREHIFDLLKRFKPGSVIDYGCGEGSVISFLITCNDEPPITRLAGLDISSEALSECKDRCKPNSNDFNNLRERPLKVELFRGSVDSPSQQLLGFDAIVSSEVIEHLYPETLEKFPTVVFGIYRSPLVIISTPNAEFNVLFPQLNYLQPNATFRDDDHKFEWTRAEFQEWCQINCDKYGYDVEYSGVGKTPKEEDRHLGFCTQFAVFKRKDVSPKLPNSEFREHEVVADFEFPWFNKQVTDSDRMDCILNYAKYMPPVSTSVPEAWPIFKIEAFWGLLKVRQYNRTLQNFLDFILTPSRNGGKLSLQDDAHFILHQIPEKLITAFDKKRPEY
ncbi:hypothetical protein DSO57_1005557 [Entomophthora muscae]|uniref:Uncharacterized protein n=1 Tax=Entomophthora muscae TaxID=34485 RepID=A0ACC2TIW7_9FUNG|nr:hypothetical protein DSO57_1005557 [Entomophthora muscae]